MKKLSSAISVLLALSMLFVLTTTTAAANNSVDAQITLNGNSGATITLDSTATVTTSDTDLVSVSTSGKTVTVEAVADAVGIANIDITSGGEVTQVEIPVGYTTFIFDGDNLKIYEGSDTEYKVETMNIDGTEGDAEGTAEDGYTLYSNVDTTTLSAVVKKAGGTYVFSGKSDDMIITVKKAATAPANILLAGLDLASSYSSPITINKESQSTVTINALKGYENTLTDSATNNADIYGDTADGGDGTNAAFAESAVIKGKSYANLTICGGGTLT